MSTIVFWILAFLTISSIDAWNYVTKKQSIKPPVWSISKNGQNPDTLFYHKKNHFNIIIPNGTTFNVSVQASQKLVGLKFYCLTTLSVDTIIELNFKNAHNVSKTITSNFDCVPMVSVSYTVPVTITIETQKWSDLPIFDYLHLTTENSEKHELAFFENVQTYGFVENHHTQMLISAEDVVSIKSGNYSLHSELKKQLDILNHYNYLLGNNTDFSQLNIFFRSESSVKRTESQKHPDDDKSCNYVTSFTKDSIIASRAITEFFNSNEEHVSWSLLHEIGKFYEIRYFEDQLKIVGDVWRYIFAYFYLYNHSRDMYLKNVSNWRIKRSISNYHEAVPFEEWHFQEKVHFFLLLFKYNGTLSIFKELNRQHLGNIRLYNSNDMVYTLIELFLQLHNINVLPLLDRVKITPSKKSNPDTHLANLKFRLMCVDAWTLVSTTAFVQNEKKVFMKASQRIGASHTFVNITSPVSLKNKFFHANDGQYQIYQHQGIYIFHEIGFEMIYFADKINDRLFISDVQYPLIHDNMNGIDIVVKEVSRDQPRLPFIYYYIDYQCTREDLEMRIFVNYEDLTIEVMVDFDKHSLGYLMIHIERNGGKILDYMNIRNGPIKWKTTFQVNDVLSIESSFQSCYLKINGNVENVERKGDKSFVSYKITEIGLMMKQSGNLKRDVINRDFQRIMKFSADFKNCLNSNALFAHLFEYYKTLLPARKIEENVHKKALLPKTYFFVSGRYG